MGCRNCGWKFAVITFYLKIRSPYSLRSSGMALNRVTNANYSGQCKRAFGRYARSTVLTQPVISPSLVRRPSRSLVSRYNGVAHRFIVGPGLGTYL